MSLAVLASLSLHGMAAHAVRVEVHVGRGLPAFNIVGLPDAIVRESRERVRSAIVNSGFDFPPGRITANLAPADLPKQSGRFDLPIALGILLASGQVPTLGGASHGARPLRDHVFAGELSLTGAVVPVLAPLAIALGVQRALPGGCLVLPASGAVIAARVPGLKVLIAESLRAVVAHLTGERPLDQAPPESMAPLSVPLACLSDVRGQAAACRALEVAAAGGHSLLLVGPPGAGKTMMAHRLPGLLPHLDTLAALEAAVIADLHGAAGNLSRSVPFRAPHHSISRSALVGGGARPHPGEISLAHNGVLFLDELTEFRRDVLESLREPLEHAEVSISRVGRPVVFPAAFQLVAAMNPCPCGWMGHASMRCECRPEQVRRYRARISGPLLDRIDLQVPVPSADGPALHAAQAESSAVVRERVRACREFQRRRQGMANASLDSRGVEAHCQPDATASALLERVRVRWRLSARATHRILRVARTLADMERAEAVSAQHLGEAVQYRQPWGA